MDDEEEKNEAEEIIEIVNDPEFDEWAEMGYIPDTGEIPAIDDRDTEDLPAVNV